MYLFFGLAASVSLIIHTTEAAPLALDRLMLAIAFFNEGKEEKKTTFTLTLFIQIGGFPTFSCPVRTQEQLH